MKQTLFIVFISFVLLTSCRDELSTAGGKWVVSALGNVLTDSCTVSISTILSDSLATSGDTVCQIGHRNDTTWGDIRASFYAEYEVPAHSFTENIPYTYDSITLRLYTSGNYLGDTLAAQRINLHALAENVTLDEGYLYNTTRLAYEATPLASFTLQPHPGQRSKKTEIRLPDSWGERWFNLMLSKSDKMESQDFFRQYFRGLAFIPEEGSGNCVNGFQVNDSSLCITVYYHKTEATTTQLTLDFKPSSTLTYNKVEYDRNGTALAGLQSGISNALPSEKSNHQAYLQGMTGMYLNIEFPYLNNLCAKGELVTIESATLWLYPVRGSYAEGCPLPESLTLYTANEDNVRQDVITNISGNSVQTGDLVTDEEMYRDTYYSFDLTAFLQQNLGTVGYNRQRLQLMLPDNTFYTTLKGVVFGDSSHPATSNNVKLTVLYKTYNR